MNRLRLIKRYARAIVLCSLTSALTACALFVPQVKPAKIEKVDPLLLTSCYLSVGATEAERKAAAQEIAGTPNAATSARIALCWAYTYAEQWRLAYWSAARQHSGTRAIAGAVAIPLAGVAAFKGATQENATHSTTGLIIGAAALYGAVTFLTSLSREEVYLNGALAMSCVRGAAQPLLQATARLGGIDRAKNDLAASLKTFDERIRFENINLAFPQNADLVVSRTNAVNALNKAGDLSARVHGFAEALRNRVETISIQVAKLIKASEPSPQSMLSILSSIGSISGGLQAGLTIPKPEKAPVAGEGQPQSTRSAELAAAQADLERKTTDLQEELKVVSGASEEAATAAKAGDCTPQGVKSTFSVQPDASALVVAQGATTRVTVTASDGFPSQPVVDGNEDGFIKLDPYTIDTASPSSDRFILTVHGEKPTGSNPPVLKITDHANEVRKSITISVTAKTAAATVPKPQAPAPAAEPLTLPEADLLKAPMMLAGELQCVVEAPVDCKVNTQTRNAIITYRKKKSLPDSREIDQRLVSAIMQDLEEEKVSCKGAGKDLEACK